MIHLSREQRVELILRSLKAWYDYPNGYNYGKLPNYESAEESHKNNLKRNKRKAEPMKQRSYASDAHDPASSESLDGAQR